MNNKHHGNRESSLVRSIHDRLLHSPSAKGWVAIGIPVVVIVATIIIRLFI